MAKLVEYTVARGHHGDKITDEGMKSHKFTVGEKRLADPNIVKHLVKSGHLIAPDGEDGDDLRQDGPTVSEFVAAGYQADDYPPRGYASRSTDEEIADAQRQQAAARKTGSDGGGAPAPAATTTPARTGRTRATTGTVAAKAEPTPAANKSEGNSTETKVEQPAANKGGSAVQTKAE